MSTLIHGTPSEAGMDADRINNIVKQLPSWMDGNAERGGVFLAARKGKIVLHEAAGTLTDRPDSPAMKKDSIFQVSSLTKPITATGIMLLVEDGLLGLNRPIKEYFPEICGEGTDAVEVQHLLTHTSGFREEACWQHFALGSDDVTVQPQKDLHPISAKYLEAMKDVKSHFAPGSLMHYCNHNYALLSDLIRRVSGQATDTFFKERLFDPLGMEGTCYIRDKSKLSRQVIRGENVPMGSAASASIGKPEGTIFEEVPSGYMGANSTALDLAIMGQMLLNGGIYGDSRLLSSSSVREMTRDQLPGISAEINEMQSGEASWGLGWSIQGNQRWTWYNSTLVPRGSFWHTGAGGSLIWIDPINEIVGVYLAVNLIESVGSSEIQWHGDIFQNMVTAAVI